MKIFFLGTGGGDFGQLENPECTQGYIPRALELGGRNLRHASQAVILQDILIDFHPDRQLKTFDVPPDSIRHLFITHGHFDHFQPGRILDFAAQLPHRLEVYGNRMVADALGFAMTHIWDDDNGKYLLRDDEHNVAAGILEPGKSITVGDTTVTAVHANHMMYPPYCILEQVALNYIFERDGKSIFYGLDSSYLLPETLEVLRRFRLDLAVFDASYGHYPVDPITSGHHNFEMLDRTISELREAGTIHDKTTVVGSHMALQCVKPHDDLVDELSQKGQTLAYDGLTIEV